MILFGAFNANAQSQTELDKVLLPKFMPPSPEASAFMKVGFGTNNMSTGAATANIPLYTIKLKDFTFPISLSYSTQGLKADEVSSRVGLGWVLNATGMITRSVHGIPDEFGTRVAPPAGYPSGTDAQNTVLASYYSLAADPGQSEIDTQIDEFNFQVNGQTGSFVLNNSYIPIPTTATNAKITASITPGSGGHILWIIIQTADGVKYRFGYNGAYEKTNNTSSASTDPYHAATKTAFFLDLIVLPENDSISFNYLPITYTVATGQTQTVIANEPGYEGTPNSSTITQDNVGYDTQLLNSIQVSNGVLVNFDYAASGTATRLVDLEVVGQKHYEFTYENTSRGYNPRFFLTELNDVTGTEVLHYDFEYDRIADVPDPITFSQDYLGFYNASGAAYVIPPDLTYIESFDPVTYSPPSTDAARLGTLTAIHYPTGGTEEFIYEANTKVKDVIRAGQFTNITVSGTGGGSGGSYEPATYWRHNIYVPFTQQVTVIGWSGDAAADYPAQTDHHNMNFSLYDETDPDHVGEMFTLGAVGIDNKKYSLPVTLQAGHVYAIKLEAEHYTEISFVSFDYKLYENPIVDKVNVVTPGVRVKQIRYTDPFTGSTHSKYYTYATLDDLTLSTGSVFTAGYSSTAIIKKYTADQPNDPGSPYIRKIFSNSTGQHVYALYKTPIYYPTVIESDDPCMTNGGTEYTFFPIETGSAIDVKLGETIPVGGGQFPTMTGVVKSKRVFDRTKTIVQTEEDTWQTLIDISGMPKSYAVRKDFEPMYADLTKLAPYAVTEVSYGNYWNRILKKSISTFAGGTEHKQETTFTYETGTTANMQPSDVEVNDSRQHKWKTHMTYPTTDTNSSVPGWAALIDQNRVSIPITKYLYHDNVLQQSQMTLYKVWYSNVVSPEKVQMKESPTDVLHDELVYLSYSAKGHPTHVKKANDVEIAYIWDDALALPIAEAKNSAPDEIAYTSFEDNGHGGWGWDVPASSDIKFTGNKSLVSSETSASVDRAGTYIISLWTNGGAPTVHWFYPSPVSIKATTGIVTINGWTLYNIKVNVFEGTTFIVSILDLSGNIVTGAAMDELRLYPPDAEMSTFTYNPWIGEWSQNDPTNHATFYEYDDSNRLIIIRDHEQNIVKTIDYAFQLQH
ncbi:MAG: hypothetical protein WDO14_24910 [Bacteroidota bacterium]